MKTINLKPLVKLLRGILDGSLSLVGVEKKIGKVSAPQKRGRKPGVVAKRGRKPAPVAKKRGRKPASSAIKKQKQFAAQRAKIRKEKSLLPTPREIFVFLADKLEGAKITELASYFKVKRAFLKLMLGKLVAKGDLTEMGGKFFLQRRLRGVGGKKTAEKAPAISEKEILGYLGDHPGATMSEMAKALGSGKYQRLIKILNKLAKDGKVKKEGKGYRLENPF